MSPLQSQPNPSKADENRAKASKTETTIDPRGASHGSRIGRGSTLEYRMRGDDWRTAPGDFGWHESRELGGVTPEEITGKEHNAIQAAMDDLGQQAPLAWAMFQRALRSAHSDPRVSLVLAVAAAEIALKQCLVALDSSPVASWTLIDEQAPSWSNEPPRV